MKPPLEIRIHQRDTLNVAKSTDAALAFYLWGAAPHRAFWPFRNLDTAIAHIRDDNEFDTTVHFFDHATQEYVFRFRSTQHDPA